MIGGAMEKREHSRNNACWLDKENQVLSFHYEEGFELKEFDSRDSLMAFCITAISTGYKIQ